MPEISKRPKYWTPKLPAKDGHFSKTGKVLIREFFLNFFDLLPYPMSELYEGLNQEQIQQVRFAVQQIMQEFKNSLNKRDYYELTVHAVDIVKKKSWVRYEDLMPHAFIRAAFNAALAF